MENHAREFGPGGVPLPRAKPEQAALYGPRKTRGVSTLLTVTLISQIETLLAVDFNRTACCRLLGIARTTLHQWSVRGQEENGQGLDTIHARLYRAIIRAKEEWTHRRLARVLEAGEPAEELEERVERRPLVLKGELVMKDGAPVIVETITRRTKDIRGDWKANAWLLERLIPERFKERKALETTDGETLGDALTKMRVDIGEGEDAGGPGGNGAGGNGSA